MFEIYAKKQKLIRKNGSDDGKVVPTITKSLFQLKKMYKYVYDEYYDCIICPEYHVLHYATTNREGYREYKSRSYICKNCPTIHKCTHSRKCEKVVTQHVWNDYIELAEDARYTPYYKSLYKKRKEKIERVFADAKEKHAMRYTPFRGLAQVSNWVRLKFAAMNLKKLARWLARFPLPSRFFFLFSPLTLKTQFSLTRKLGFSTG